MLSQVSDTDEPMTNLACLKNFRKLCFTVRDCIHQVTATKYRYNLRNPALIKCILESIQFT